MKTKFTDSSETDGTYAHSPAEGEAITAPVWTGSGPTVLTTINYANRTERRAETEPPPL